MGRLTISLPDDLQSELDAYAQAQGKPVSQVVADAVRALLAGTTTAAPAPTPPVSPPVAAATPAPAPVPPPAAPTPPPRAWPTFVTPPTAPPAGPIEAEDLQVRRYLEDLYGELRMMLQTVGDLSVSPGLEPPHEPPYDLPPPPWLGRRQRRRAIDE